jgi:hypothetical protein
MPSPWFEVLGDWQIDNGTARQLGSFADPDFPRVILEDLQFTDLELSVKCRTELGSTDRACGLIFRAVDSDNYYIVRANALEDNIRLYHVVNGSRQSFASVSMSVSNNEWHTLEVEAIGMRIVISWDGAQIIDTTDDVFASGAIGLWTKADSRTSFDDLTATAR